MNKTIQGKEPFNKIIQQHMSKQVYNSLSLNQNINNKVRIINQIMTIKKHDQWYLIENLSSHQVNDQWYYKVGDAIYFSYIAW